MDKLNLKYNSAIFRKSRYLILSLFCILIFASSYYYFSSDIITIPFFWLIVSALFTLLFILGIITRLYFLTQEHKTVLQQMDQDFKNEIVERMQAAETKQKLEIALLQGQKLQAIGTLAGGIAHDFNNLLYAIIGYVEMAREDTQPNSLTHQNLGKVLEAAKRGQDLVARILAFGRRHTHRDLKSIHLKIMLENILSLLQPTIPASVNIQLKGLHPTQTIVGDQTELHQVFINLINNAVDAMDGEGTIHIEVIPVSKNDVHLNQLAEIDRNKNYYQINIQDTGCGMNESTLKRIFEPFFTTKEVGKGTGLGLSTVHAILKDHQGSITVKSKLGQGTTFSIYLPEHTLY